MSEQTPTPNTAHENIVAAVCAVMAEMPTIAKDSYNSHQKYKYFSEKALTDAIRPILAKHGLCYDWSCGEPAADGKVLTVPFVFRLQHESGAGEMSYAVFGTAGTHMGDKAMYAAMTNATKYFLSKAFCASIGEDDVEHDNNQARNVAAQSKVKPEKAKPLCPPDLQAVILAMIAEYEVPDEVVKKALAGRGVTTIEALTQAQAEEFRDGLESKYSRTAA